MADIKVTIVDNNCDLFKNAAQDAIERALEKIGLVAEGYAKRLCPVDTGRLRNSITHALAGKPAAIKQYQSNKTHARTKANKARGTAGNPAEVTTGEYSGTAPEDTSPHINSVFIGTNVVYAPYIELGTRRMKAKPFLRPAVENHKKLYRQIVEDELKNA